MITKELVGWFFKNNLFVFKVKLPDLGAHSIPGINYETGSCSVHAILGRYFQIPPHKFDFPSITAKQWNKQWLPFCIWGLQCNQISQMPSDERSKLLMREKLFYSNWIKQPEQLTLLNGRQFEQSVFEKTIGNVLNRYEKFLHGQFCPWIVCLHGSVQIMLQIAVVFTRIRANFRPVSLIDWLFTSLLWFVIEHGGSQKLYVVWWRKLFVATSSYTLQSKKSRGRIDSSLGNDQEQALRRNKMFLDKVPW